MKRDLDEFFSKMFIPRLVAITGIEDLDLTEAKKVCSTLYWMKASRMEMKVQLTEEDWNFCGAIMDSNLYLESGLITKESLDMGSYEALNIMREISKMVIEPSVNNNEIWEGRHINRYFESHFKNNLDVTTEPHWPLIMSFIGHQENVAFLMRALGNEESEKAAF